MKPSLAQVGTPGVSLNFDAQALQEQEEAEYHREELQQQNELKQLLEDALDDLSDDDDQFELSQDPTILGSHLEDKTNIQEQPWPTPAVSQPHMFPMAHAHTSTPIVGMAPPLTTPVPGQHCQFPQAAPTDTYMPNHDHPARGSMNYEVDQQEDAAGAQRGFHSWDQQYAHHPNNHQYSSVPFSKRGETEGGNEERDMYYDHVQRSNYINGAYGNPMGAQGQEMPNFHDYHGGQPTGDVFYNGGYQQPSSLPHDELLVGRKDLYGNENTQMYRGVDMHPSHPQSPPHLENKPSLPLNPGGNLENYRVAYRGSQPLAQIKSIVEHHLPTEGHVEGRHKDTADPADALSSVNNFDQLQRDFLTQGGAGDERQMAQLQILYEARGRKLEEITQEYENFKEESCREVRILKHKVALLQDERDGLANSMEQSKQLMVDAKQKEANLHGKNVAIETQIQALAAAKEELVKKLHTAESTIESLNAQLHELGSSESLSRAREQHQSVVSGMQQKYDAQILVLKEKLDEASRDGEIKTVEIEGLKKRVNELVKSVEGAHIDRADTVNRLTRSLEDSQTQCRVLLESGTGQELGKLKIQLQEAIANKSIAEDMSTALQGEIRELKEQVMMYESASTFGVHVLPSTHASTIAGQAGATPLDDSYVQLGIKRFSSTPLSTDLKTPPGNRSEISSLTPDETIHGLKNELERCLGMYRQKRQQVSQLQGELNTAKTSLDEIQAKLQVSEKLAQESQMKLQSLEEKLGPDDGSPGSLMEAKLRKQVDCLAQDKELLKQELENTTQRLEEIASSEEKVKELNRELSTQMAQLVKEFDEDKRIAIEKCQDASLQHHEASKEKFREELSNQWMEEKTKLELVHTQTLAKLKQDLKDSQAELDEVKALYVNVCEAKDKLEATMDAVFQEKLEAQLIEIKEKLAVEKQEELKRLMATITSSDEAASKASREKLLHEQEEIWKNKLETQLAVAKLEWLKEHQLHEEQAIKVAVLKNEEQWKTRIDKELDCRMDERLNKAQEQWQKVHDKQIESEVKDKVAQERQVWQQTDLQIALATERQRLTQAVNDNDRDGRQALGQEDIQAKVQAAVTTAREEWDASNSQKVEQAVSKALDEAIKQVRDAANKDVQRQVLEATSKVQQDIDKLRAEKYLLEAQVLSNEESWGAEKVETIRKKDLERREAVTNIQDQCEKDYRQFLQEHQDTLDKALKSAREQNNTEKENLIKKHQEEIVDLKSKYTKLKEVEQHLIKEKCNLEKKYKNHVDELEQAHKILVQDLHDKYEGERIKLTNTHRENLQHALVEAKAQWQQKCNQSTEQIQRDSNGSTQTKSEVDCMQLQEELDQLQDELVQLQGEVEQLHQEVETRDALLQAADSHMEAEINKLQDDMHHEMEREKLQLQANLEEQYNQRLCSELDNLRERIQLEHEEQQSSADNEKIKLIGGLEQARQQLKQLEQQNEEERGQLRRRAENKEKEVKKLLKQLDEKSNALEQETKQKKELVQTMEQQQVEMSQKFKELQSQVRRAEQLRQEAVESYKKSEKEHATLLETYNQRHEELLGKLKRAEKKIRATEAMAEKHLHEVQESLEREHTVAMDNMKAKMVELRNSHVAAVEKLRKRYSAEKQNLELQLNLLREQQRVLTHTPTQTDGDSGSEAVTELKVNYLDAINKMREEVLQHVQESSEKAADTVRKEVAQERQRTAKRLRKYYLKCLSQLLQCDQEGFSMEQKLVFMERALDNLPDRDSSCSSSRSTSIQQDVSIPTSARSASHGGTQTMPKSGKRLSRSQESVNDLRIDLPTYPSSQSDWDMDSAFTTPRSTTGVIPHQNGTVEVSQPKSKRKTPPLLRDQQTGQLKLSLAHSPTIDILGDISVSNNLTHQMSPQLSVFPGAGSCGKLLPEGDSGTPGEKKMTVQHQSGNAKPEYSDCTGSVDPRRTYSVQQMRVNDGGNIYRVDSKSPNFQINEDINKSYSTQTTPRRDTSHSRTPSSRSTSRTKQSHSTHTVQSKGSHNSRQAHVNISQSVGHTFTTRATPGSVTSGTDKHSWTECSGKDKYGLEAGREENSKHQNTPVGAQSNCLDKVQNVLVRNSKHSKDPSTKLGSIYTSAQQAVNKTYLCRSEEALHATPPESTRTVSSTYKYTSILNSHLALSPRNAIDMGTSPLKSKSLTDVAGACDLTWTMGGSSSLTDIPQVLSNGLERYKMRQELPNSDNSSQESTSFVTSRSPGSRCESLSQKRRPDKASGGSHHVAFQSFETYGDNDGSDTESHKSFASGSSVHSFRHALKQKSTSKSPTSSVTARKPIRALPRSPDPQCIYGDVPGNVYKPIAMVTRETQIPSPAPHKSRHEWHVRRFEDNI